MRLGGVGAVRAALADGGLANDQGGALGGFFGLHNRVGHQLGVMAVNGTQHVPAVGDKTQRSVVNKPGRHLPVYRDAVAVVQRDQLVELPGAGQCGGFVANAFHQAAIAQKHIAVVVDHGMPVAVELLRQELFCQRHAHGVGDALAERAGGGLHPGCHAHFGVAGGLAVQLAEVFQLFHRQLVAGQVQQRVDQHRAVAVGQHEAVTVKPVRVGRVVLQVPAPQCHRHVGHAHRCTGVARVGLLDRVHRQGANRVGHVGLVRDADLFCVCHG